MLVIQDDVFSEGLHLDEVLLSLIPSADCGAAAFAFVTRDGLNAVFNSEEFKEYCRRGHHFELYIGIDSITNEHTLEFAKKLAHDLGDRLMVKVYYSEGSQSIFHPKTTWFKNADSSGRGTVLVGSGNLTLNGLQRNAEMFGWIDQDSKGFTETLNSWNNWLYSARKNGRIYDVDDPRVVACAKSNRWNNSHGVRISDPDQNHGVRAYGEKPVMISAIPSQRTRGWSQFAMAKQYYGEYFGFEYEVLEGRAVTKGSRRVLLHAVNNDGTLMPTESRGGNISGGSRNFRMELDAARKVVVSQGGHPMVIFLKTGSRSFLYQVFGTDSPYNGRLVDFAVRHNNKLRKNDNPKCWCEVEPLQREMPELAILTVKVPDGHDG